MYGGTRHCTKGKLEGAPRRRESNAMRERVRGASRRYFDVFCLDGRGRSGTLFFQHQPISIANVFFQLLERRAWAKDTWYRQRCQIQAAGHFPARRPAQLVAGARLPVAILPILETESNSLLHRKHWWRRRESNPRPRKPAVKSLRCVSDSKFSVATSEPARAVVT